MAELGSGSGSSYPVNIDTRQTYENRPDAIADSPRRIDAELVNDVLAAVVQLEAELGVNPRGAYATVAARLAAGEGADPHSQYLDETRHDALDHAGLTGIISDHGALAGLDDDDHAQYLLADGSRALTGTLTVTGKALLNGVASAFNTKGLLIHQLGEADEALTFKASAIGHGMTSMTDTDTWAYIKLQDANAGGFTIRGFSEGTMGAILGGIGTTMDSTKGAAGVAPIMLVPEKKDGTFTASLGANENAVGIVGTGGNTAHLFDASGNVWHAGGLELGGALKFAQISAPETTVDRLYNVGGVAKWNGQSIVVDNDVRLKGWVPLAETVLSQDTTTVTFSNISGAYRTLVLRGYGRTDEDVYNWDNVYIQFNDDTGNNYSWQYLSANNTTVGANAAANYGAAFAGQLSTVLNETDLMSGFTCFIDGYASTSYHKSFYSVGTAVFDTTDTASALSFLFLAGQWNSQSAITKIKLLPTNGTVFKAGTIFTLFGIPVL